MARIQKPPPGQLIVSIIYSHIDAVVDALRLLEKQFGRVRCETVDIQYTNTDRYEEEMGSNLVRRLFSFEKLVERDSLPEIKSVCQEIERQLGDQVGDFVFRAANLDPGVLTPDNLVMASNREYNHRIYLADGVFAEIQLIWAHGQFTRLPWTNHDFCDDEVVDFLIRVRQTFDLLDEHQITRQPA